MICQRSVLILYVFVNLPAKFIANQNPCKSNPCLHGGKCSEMKKTDKKVKTRWYICKCLPEYFGLNCETVGLVGRCEDRCATPEFCTDVSKKDPEKIIRETLSISQFNYLNYLNTEALKSIFVYKRDGEEKMCHCKEGQYGPECKQKCRPGYFGRMCVGYCSTCRKQDCSEFNGWCNKGCVDGYGGEYCREDEICQTGRATCVHGFCRNHELELSIEMKGRLMRWTEMADRKENHQKCICDDGFEGVYCNKKCKKEKYLENQGFGFMCKQKMEQSCSRCIQPWKHCSLTTGRCKTCKPGFRRPYCHGRNKGKTKRLKLSDTDDQSTQENPLQKQIKDNKTQTTKVNEVDVTVQMNYVDETSNGETQNKWFIPPAKSPNQREKEMVKVDARVQRISKQLADSKAVAEDQDRKVEQLTEQKENLEKRITALNNIAAGRDGETQEFQAVIDKLKAELDAEINVKESLAMKNASLLGEQQKLNDDLSLSTAVQHIQRQRVVQLENENSIVQEDYDRLLNQEKLEMEMRSSVKRTMQRRMSANWSQIKTRISSLRASLKQRNTTPSPNSMKKRRKRQDPLVETLQLSVEMFVTFVPVTLVNDDLKATVTSAVKESGDTFQSEVIPSLYLDKDSVQVTSANVPDALKAEDADYILPTAILYVVPIVLVCVIISAVAMWFCVYRRRSGRSTVSQQMQIRKNSYQTYSSKNVTRSVESSNAAIIVPRKRSYSNDRQGIALLPSNPTKTTGCVSL